MKFNQVTLAAEFADETLAKKYAEAMQQLENEDDYVIVDTVSEDLTQAEFESIAPNGFYNNLQQVIGKPIDLNGSECIGTMAIKTGETKTITWSSKKFETGLPGYKWSWSLTVNIKARADGKGYDFDSATYSVSTHQSPLEIIAMQYQSYSCLLQSKSCTHTVKSDKVVFSLSVTYDISYLLSGQSLPTAYSVPGNDTHEVLLK